MREQRKPVTVTFRTHEIIKHALEDIAKAQRRSLSWVAHEKMKEILRDELKAEVDKDMEGQL